MMRFVVLAVVVASAYGCGLPTFPPVLSRVVAGEDARPHSWPWQVRILCLLCTTIYALVFETPYPLRTCSSRYNYRVELGKHNLKDTEEGNSWVSPTPSLSVTALPFVFRSHDIALIKLSSPVTFSDTIMPACLPDPGFVLPHGAPCYVTGWGRLSSDGPPADTLQQALLPVVGHDTCSQNDWWSVLATDKMVCAGGDGIKAGCNGDSGGPLNCQNPDGSWDVHGVVSFGSGQGCNVLQKPTVFTQVSSYIDWINRVSNIFISSAS
uniref:pancreatic elastase II n=1 Tax=Myripristis murdjan TaxID=586833 RepID=A0A667XAZ9_9TELE